MVSCVIAYINSPLSRSDKSSGISVESFETVAHEPLPQAISHGLLPPLRSEAAVRPPSGSPRGRASQPPSSYRGGASQHLGTSIRESTPDLSLSLSSGGIRAHQPHVPATSRPDHDAIVDSPPSSHEPEFAPTHIQWPALGSSTSSRGARAYQARSRGAVGPPPSGARKPEPAATSIQWPALSSSTSSHGSGAHLEPKPRPGPGAARYFSYDMFPANDSK